MGTILVSALNNGFAWTAFALGNILKAKKIFLVILYITHGECSKYFVSEKIVVEPILGTPNFQTRSFNVSNWKVRNKQQY